MTSTLSNNNRKGTIDLYPSYPNETVNWRRGRRPNKLHRTMVNLDVGWKFFYPYTTANSIYRKAREINIEVVASSTEGGFWVTRVD